MDYGLSQYQRNLLRQIAIEDKERWAFIGQDLAQRLVTNEIERAMGETLYKMMPPRTLIDFKVLKDGTARMRLTEKGWFAMAEGRF